MMIPLICAIVDCAASALGGLWRGTPAGTGSEKGASHEDAPLYVDSKPTPIKGQNCLQSARRDRAIYIV